MKTIFGVKDFALSEYAIAANAVLGIRDSGKTYTATEATEELFDAGIPSLWLDPIGVAHNLRIPGKGKGYPIVVAGGRFGDLPLTVKNAGAIVRAAMQQGVSLVIDLFSTDLSKSDWRKIVRECVEILLYENHDFGLRHVFIEEAAEFVPQRVMDGQVFAAVEKLVRMGGNSKLGCTLINQRSEDLNKSVLELCANVFLHRQRGKNSLTGMKKWLDLVDPAEAKKVMDSVPDLKSGECWVLSNELKHPVLLKVPEKNSLHPDRRAAAAAPGATRKAVPADKFVDAMKSALAEKPKPVPASKPVEKINTSPDTALKDREAAFAAGSREGRQSGFAEGWLAGERSGFGRGVAAVHAEMTAALRGVSAVAYVPGVAPKPPKSAVTHAPAPVQRAAAVRPTGGADGLPAPQRRVLASIGFWLSVGNPAPSRAQVGGVAGYSPSSGGFNNLLGALNTAGLITIPLAGRVALAENAPYDALTAEEAKAKVYSVISPPQRKLVDAALEAGDAISRDDLGAATGYSPSSGGFNNLIGSLNTLTIFEKPSPGMVCLSAWAREVLS